jgi:hypothetical protein
MDKEKTDEIIKQMKENKFCAFCDNEKLFDGVGIQLVSISESGQLMTPYDTKLSSMSAMVPACGYHMVLAQEGLLAVTTQNQLIQARILTEMEKLSDDELKHVLLKVKRGIKSQESEVMKGCIKALINARKFHIEMIKEAKKREEEKKDE